MKSHLTAAAQLLALLSKEASAAAGHCTSSGYKAAKECKANGCVWIGGNCNEPPATTQTSSFLRRLAKPTCDDGTCRKSCVDCCPGDLCAAYEDPVQGCGVTCPAITTTTSTTTTTTTTVAPDPPASTLPLKFCVVADTPYSAAEACMLNYTAGTRHLEYEYGLRPDDCEFLVHL